MIHLFHCLDSFTRPNVKGVHVPVVPYLAQTVKVGSDDSKTWPKFFAVLRMAISVENSQFFFWKLSYINPLVPTRAKFTRFRSAQKCALMSLAKFERYHEQFFLSKNQLSIKIDSLSTGSTLDSLSSTNKLWFAKNWTISMVNFYDTESIFIKFIPYGPYGLN